MKLDISRSSGNRTKVIGLLVNENRFEKLSWLEVPVAMYDLRK
jgi:hypothetical protein